jgi:hypothetical protein
MDGTLGDEQKGDCIAGTLGVRSTGSEPGLAHLMAVSRIMGDAAEAMAAMALGGGR